MTAKILEPVLKRFCTNSWPDTILFTGEPYFSKKELVFPYVVQSLANSPEKIEQTKKQMEKNIHPDFYYFPLNYIAIGDEKNPGHGTVRHLLQHFIPYRAENNHPRFVWISDAKKLRDEAESALLKTLEEPPNNIHFILFADNKEGIKQTILSRSILFHYHETNTQRKQNTWETFWLTTGYKSSPTFLLLQEKGILNEIHLFYENLPESFYNFLTFDDFISQKIIKPLQKEKLDIKTEALNLALLPLFYAAKEKILNTQASMPFSIESLSLAQAKKVSMSLLTLFQRLKLRYFGTRPPNLNLILATFYQEIYS
ncbi:MAG: hypothetical protein D6767_05030 [Candidatus Hydrogenedentota bacterium]|nr:MAG: hypothetical protein D6767_05030 [Candidatus Hydrogenedentota bacterium]